MTNLHSLSILDDEPLILVALKNELSSSYEIKFTSLDADDFFVQMQTKQPEVVLLDIRLGETNGVDVARRLRAEYPEVKILVLSIDDRRETFRQLLSIGIDGFVSKKAPTIEIMDALEVILRGEKFYGKDLARIIREIQTAMKAGNEPGLTNIELNILQLCCEGKSSLQIGKLLHMSPRTVEAHKSAMFAKLAVDSTTELIVSAIRQGIISL